MALGYHIYVRNAKTQQSSKYYADFAMFKDAIATCLSELDSKHKSALDSLLTLNFQTFKKAQFVPV